MFFTLIFLCQLLLLLLLGPFLRLSLLLLGSFLSSSTLFLILSLLPLAVFPGQRVPSLPFAFGPFLGLFSHFLLLLIEGIGLLTFLVVLSGLSLLTWFLFIR